MNRRVLVAVLLGLTPLVPLLGQDVRPLTILHSNDLHAHLMPDDRDNGGFARLATAVRQEKAHCSACLYLNAGDLVQGTPVSTLFHGSPVYEIANLLGIDVGTLGNHEFDYGWRRVLEFVKIARYPIVSSNIVDEHGEPATGNAYVIKTVGGIRVGVIGAALSDMVGTVITQESAGSWKVLPAVETVRKYAVQLRDQTDLIVVLGHIHDREEVDAILHQVPEVSVVVAGHTHVAYKSMMNVDGRVAVLVDSYGAELGRLDLQVDMAGKKLKSAEWKRIAIDKTYAEDPAVKKLVNSWEAKVTKLVDTPIGESTMRMDRNHPVLRKLIEQAMAEETGADIAWINTGNIRDTMPEGRILTRNLWNILPFDNYIVMGKFKGKDLPPKITERYPVDPDKEYTVATSDFTATNQSASDQLNTTGMSFPNTGPLQRDAVIDWIKKKKVVP
jgi:2',3'-cyclic-nucleotide 2'-phosphodiesterase (5'-nucleotidase family)